MSPEELRAKGGLGVGLYWSILFMIVGLFTVLGGMVIVMVRAARDEEPVAAATTTALPTHDQDLAA